MSGVSLLSLLTGGFAKYRLAKWARLVSTIRHGESTLMGLTDQQLRKASLSLRYRVRSGLPLDELLPEAFAMVCESASRSLGMRHYDVQLIGGMAMHFGSIAEMQTGEGKTLTATLPLYLAALKGRGAHLATANDYLAQRDADWMRPVFETLGMTVGVIQSQTPRAQRRAAYRCNVTYAAAKELGFDFLRDRLLIRHAQEGGGQLLAGMLGHNEETDSDQPVQPEHYFVLVDEADSILIDEARTPLIVSSLPSDTRDVAEAAYLWAADVVSRFSDAENFEYDHERRVVTLTAAGRRLVRQLPKPAELSSAGMLDLYQHIERALKVDREMVRDRHYVLRDDEIVIVDEFTGRLAEGRRWRDGIHQAVEAREGVEISLPTGDAARITVQDFFLRYDRLAGMTGTAASSKRELQRIYELHVVSVPTNRPPRRERLPDAVVGTSEAKWKAIVAEVKAVHKMGRPVLVGTRSIDKSELLSHLLHQQGIDHQVLNARHLAAEAKIVAEAGHVGKVTVATNMAGRGTDIKLNEEALKLGGLHVICSDLHESRRIDRQLVGRCGRQGDVGSYRYFLALDDDILHSAWGPKKAERVKRFGENQSIATNRYARLLRRAQERVERQHFRQRKMLLYQEKERRKVQDEMGQDPFLDALG
ncbi:MAG: preprotein translocase subunit SecA [Planctomycetes bacterium]|nr:preprotein translocase subunit SecA [Planctomycetota bacterium]